MTTVTLLILSRTHSPLAHVDRNPPSPLSFHALLPALLPRHKPQRHIERRRQRHWTARARPLHPVLHLLEADPLLQHQPVIPEQVREEADELGLRELAAQAGAVALREAQERALGVARDRDLRGIRGRRGWRRQRVVHVRVGVQPALGRDDLGRGPVARVVVHARVVGDHAAVGREDVRGLGAGGRGGGLDRDGLLLETDARDGDDNGEEAEGLVL